MLKRAKAPYFSDLRSPFHLCDPPERGRRSRQADAKVFKKYSQMKLQMKRETLQKIDRKANEGHLGFESGAN